MIDAGDINTKITALFGAFYNKQNDNGGATRTYENFNDFADKSDVDKQPEELKDIWYSSAVLQNVESITNITIHGNVFTSDSTTDFSIGNNNRLKVPLWEFNTGTKTLLFSVPVIATLTEPFDIDGTLYRFSFSPDITELTPDVDYTIRSDRGDSWLSGSNVTQSTTPGIDFDITLTVGNTSINGSASGIEVKPNGTTVDDSQGNNYCITKKITNGVLSFGITDFDAQMNEGKDKSILLMYLPGWASTYEGSKEAYTEGVTFDYTYYWLNNGIGHFRSILKLATE